MLAGDSWRKLLSNDVAVLVLWATAGVLLHTVTNGEYGFHDDELATLDDARSLDWGYVAYPPVTPFLARVAFVLCATRKEAEVIQKQKRADLERHRETRFDVDDRQMFSLARDLAAGHGYTVLQAVQEWNRSKGSSKAMPLGEVIDKFLATKSNRSPAYTVKLNDDLALLESHFGADRPIDRIRSDEIEDFLDSKKAAGRRRINLRSEIITLFKYAQNRLRALPRELDSGSSRRDSRNQLVPISQIIVMP